MGGKIGIILLFVLFTAPALAVGQEGRTLINGIQANNPPFSWIDEAGRPRGFDVEMLDYLAAEAGFTVEHRPRPWGEMIQALLDKKIDLICADLSITPERAALVAFSAPYLTNRLVFVVGQDSGYDQEALLKSGLGIGVKKQALQAAVLERARRDENNSFVIYLYNSNGEIADALAAGRIQAGFMESTGAERLIADGRRLALAGAFGRPNKLGIATRREDAELMGRINRGLEKLLRDPYFRELQERYFGGVL